jgi:hypothetical protein
MNILLLLLLIPSFFLSAETQFPWIVYYGNQATSEAFSAYNPIIFNSVAHPPLEPLLKDNKEVLGYLSLAEAEETDAWFPLLKEKGLLIRPNPNWPKSWLIDIRNPLWKSYVVNTIMPGLVVNGFTGVFLDQIDVALEMEKEDPQHYKGMGAAAVEIIKRIHSLFPRMRIMMNRAYEILPQVGNYIAYELAETLYTSYDFGTKKYFLRPKGDFEWQLGQINAGRAQFPHLVLFSLDYWDPQDKAMYKTIYDIEEKAGLRPFVSTINLDVIPQ